MNFDDYMKKIQYISNLLKGTECADDILNSKELNLKEDFQYICLSSASNYELVNEVIARLAQNGNKNLVEEHIKNISMNMWKDLFYILLPAVYCYIIVNLDERENLDYYIDFAFWGFVINFVLIATPQSFTMANLMSISFADSYSPWESGLADMFIICFMYYHSIKKRLNAFVALLLNALSFKRIHVFYMILFILIHPFLKNKRVPRSVEIITKIFFILSPILIYASLSDSFSAWFESSFGMDLNSFTMGRFNQLDLICDLDENLTGLGMTHYMLIIKDFPIHRLHCDIMRLFLETTVVGLVVFVNNYINIAKRNQKGFMIMLLFFIVMLSSTFMENCFYWLMIFLVIENFERKYNPKEAQNEA